jgi:GNAT superfamily N-acetyltransferase
VALHARPATLKDVQAICRICTEGWRETYAGLLPPEVIERTVADFYNEERVRGEIKQPEGWSGWLVAEADGEVLAAGGGGLIAAGVGEVFVLYADPARRREGAGTVILQAITEQQRREGAREQWVSVEPDNEKGLPFYRAHGFVQRGVRRAYGSAASEGRMSLRLWRQL